LNTKNKLFIHQRLSILAYLSGKLDFILTCTVKESNWPPLRQNLCRKSSSKLLS